MSIDIAMNSHQRLWYFDLIQNIGEKESSFALYT